MSDIQDRLKFNSGTDKVTKSVADAVSEVLNSGQAPQTRMEKQAALHNYPLQDKPEVAETFVNELKQEVAQLFQQEDASNDKSDDGEGLDKADPKAAKKKFKDRKDKDIDNDGDVDSSDKFLHKKRKAISKAMDKKEGTQTEVVGKVVKKVLNNPATKVVGGTASGAAAVSGKNLSSSKKKGGKLLKGGKKEDATETKYDGRSKSFKETLRRLGYVKKSSLIYDNKRTGK